MSRRISVCASCDVRVRCAFAFDDFLQGWAEKSLQSTVFLVPEDRLPDSLPRCSPGLSPRLAAPLCLCSGLSCNSHLEHSHSAWRFLVLLFLSLEGK